VLPAVAGWTVIAVPPYVTLDTEGAFAVLFMIAMGTVRKPFVHEVDPLLGGTVKLKVSENAGVLPVVAELLLW